MTCDLIMEWLDDYLDNQLDEHNRITFEKHLSECETCQMLVEDLRSMKEVMQDMPLMALPTDFNETLHDKLLVAAEEVKAAQQQQKKIIAFPVKMKHFVKYAGAAAAVVVVAASAAQLNGSFWWNQNNQNEASYEIANAGGPGEVPPATYNMAADQAAGDMAGGTDGSSTLAASAPDTGQGAPQVMGKVAAPMSSPAPQEAAATDTSRMATAFSGRDLIRSGDINLKVAKFEVFYQDIEKIMAEAGGYVESSYSGMTPYYEGTKLIGSQLTGSVVLRIPSQQFPMVFDRIKAMGEVQSSQQNIVDVTSQISDMKANLDNLKARETRLRELMKEAKNVTEVMTVERELGTVRTQIDQLEAGLKQQTQQVSLSTLYVNVQESPEVGSQFESIDGNLFERAKQALIKNINSGIRLFEMGFVALIAWLPVLMILGIAGFGITKTKSYKKWRQKK